MKDKVLRENIEYIRGDSHYIQIKFKSYDGRIDKMFFTVRQDETLRKIIKSLDNGIELKEDGSYIITLNPEDTNSMTPEYEYKYDIEIIIDDFVKTIALGNMILEQDQTLPNDEKQEQIDDEVVIND